MLTVPKIVYLGALGTSLLCIFLKVRSWKILFLLLTETFVFLVHLVQRFFVVKFYNKVFLIIKTLKLQLKKNSFAFSFSEF